MLHSIVEQAIIIIEDKNYNQGFRIINDFRNAKIIAGESEVKALIETLRNNRKIFDKRISAILTNTPNQVALTTIYQMNLKDSPINVEIFSTLQAAIKWLGISLDNLKLINDAIMEMKNIQPNT
jgi:hypothetical protein